MNHIYRLVWSQVRRTWLVVSELARGRGKAGRTSTPRRTRSAWWAALPLSLPMLALAAAPTGLGAPGSIHPAATIVAVRPAILPAVIAPVVSPAHSSGGQVIAGSGRIDYGDHLTTIQQHSQNLSLNWLSFNIGAQDTVNFLQPNAQSIAVNRIADPNGSVILGHLNANGQVFLINPNGVLFGAAAQVNVGGLVASTLDLSDRELGRGTLHFAGAGGGSVTNRGTITAAPGGYVALLGHAVSNQGTIHAPTGSVALAGGSAATLSFDGSHLLDMQVDASTLNALAENRQLVVADGGQVLMSAGAKDSLLASVVNNSGTIQARTVENRAGKIVLLGGMAAGTTQVAGTLDASAPDGGDGGFIETSAAHVQVADATKISTLAAAGNSGTWLIDPHDFTIAASGGDITGTTLNSQLGGGNVTIESSQGANASGSGDIHVNDAVTWSANTLTLTAARTIDIHAVMTASGSAGLALNPITGNGADAGVGGGTVNVMPGEGGRVDFTGSSNTLKINGQPYTIITMLGAAGSTTKTDLQGINGGLGGHYALGANIDASATASWNGNLGFAPLGDASTNFTGTFEGLGHTIGHLTIDRPSSYNIGLFGYAGYGSAIRNVGLLGGSVTGAVDVGALVGCACDHSSVTLAYATTAVRSTTTGAGGLVGRNYNSTISQAYATGTVSGADNVGGLVGNNGDSGYISQAYATGAVSGSGHVGGLAGYSSAYGDIRQAHATGAVIGGTDVGGLVGWNGNVISEAYATGTVNGSSNVGGLAGYSFSYGYIGQAYATGAVNGGSLVGGLVGYSDGGRITQAYAIGAVNGTSEVGGLVGRNADSSIHETYATGAVSGSTGFVGGLVGRSSDMVYNSYWDTETTGQATSYGGTPLTTAALIAVLPGGFTAAWANGDNQTTPYLLGMSGNQVFNKNDLPGTVTRTNRPNLYTVILDVNQLQAVGSSLAGRYVLGNSIDASATSGWNGGAGFAPFGDPGAPFKGIFDGLGHTINSLTINRPSTNGVGLFGINTGAIRNVGLLGGSVTGRDFVGSLVGSNVGTINQAYATGAVHGSDYVGGLVGVTNGTISQTYATGAVHGTNYVGGLAGGNSGTISVAYATGAVSGSDSYVGGLTGYNGGTITNAYASGSAIGDGNFVGGLTGQNVSSGTINQAYATGSVSSTGSYVGGLIGYNSGGAISQAYATGSVIGTGYNVGGLVGLNAGGTITDSYWDTETTGQSGSDGGNTGLGCTHYCGLTTAQWLTNGPIAKGTFNTSAWVAGYPYPVLRAMPYVLVTGIGSQTYGAPTPTITGVVSADQNGYGASGLVDISGMTWLNSSPGNAGFSNVLGGRGAIADPGYQLTYIGALTVNKAPLTVTANNDSKTYDGLAYTGGNGVTYSGFVNGETASVLGGTLSYTGDSQGATHVGGYTITPGGLTTGNYALTYANSTLTVNPAPLTVTAKDSTRIYNGLAYAGGNGVTYSGFVNGETASILGGALGYTGDSQGAINTGHYTITPNGLVDGNYTITYRDGSLTVNPATLTYLANVAMITYSNTPSGLTGTVTGFVNGQTLASATTGTASFTTGATATSNVGSYAITGNGLTANYGNYTFAQATGNATALTINPATLTYTATLASSIYGSTPSGLTGTVTGFVNGQTLASATTGIASFTTAATATSNVGNYAIDGSGLTANYGNYTFAQAAGNATALTVNPALLTYLATLASSIYGSTPSGLTGTVTGFVNGQTLASATTGTASFTTAATATSNVGNYAIDGSGLTASYGNYIFTQAAGNATALTVNPATLTYTATLANSIYGSTASGLTGTVTGFANGQTLASATTGIASFTTAATATSNVGNYAIDGSGLTANYGNYTFAQAAGNATALTVNPATLTITANDASKTYGDTLTFAGNEFTASGLQNGETIGDVALTSAGAAATANVTGGPYTIASNAATGGSFNTGNYAITYKNGSLTVGQAALTVTANDASKTYDGLAYAGGHGVIYSGFVNGETTAVLGGTLGYAGGSQGAIDAGSYLLTPEGLTSGNYAITYDNGALLVNPAALIVTATDASKTYDGLAYTGGHGVTYSGFVNGETASVLGGTLGYAGDSQGATNAGGYTITPDGLTAGNYAIAYQDGHLTVDQAALTVSSSNVGKTYDGGLSAIGAAIVSGGTLFGSDTLSGGNFAFTDKNVGTGKHVTVNGVSVSDGNSGGNYAVTYADNTTSTITALGITVDATGTDRIYDGSTVDAVSLASSGILAGDTVIFSGTGAFADKNVGVAKAVGISGIVATGADAGNYSYNTTANTTADISQLGITVDATGTNRIYDGSTADAVALASADVLSGDTVNFTGTGSFANKNVGTAKAVGVSGITASGIDAGNYSFNTLANTTADITAKAITVDATGVDKVYDGSTAATITALGTTDLVAGDAVTFDNASAAFDDKNAGTGKTVTVNGIAATGADAGNYSFNTTANTTATITALGITVDATGTDRIYDGTTADTVALTSAGVLSGDTVNFSGTGAFGDKNVGVGKIVTVNGIAANGSDANNYSFNTTANTTADISQLGITVDATGTNRIYDGTTVDTVALASAGVLSGDTVNFTGTGNFANKNVGTAKAVDVSGITASGIDAGNYSFNTVANTTADITAKAITVDATGVDKVYDGSTAATITALGTTGLVAGDAVTFDNASATFDDKNVGAGKTVTVNGIVATGADAGNYSFNTTANTTATITALGITVDATGTDRIYDGTTADTVALASAGVLSGDTVNFSGTGAFGDKNVGVGKAVTVNGIAASGSDANNYSFNTTATTTADITALGITVDATGTNRIYDGTTADTVALASAGVLSGDTVNFTGTGSFDDKNVGTGKTVNVSGIAASGSDAGNYSFNTNANTTADISQRGIRVDATGTNRVYDGTTADTVALASAGVLSGDTVSFTGTGSFADKNVGAAKAVGVRGITASGSDAGNYSFNATASTTADISQLGITVDATGNNRVYDGTTADVVALASTGVLSGDTVNFAGTGAFADKHVGTGKTVSVSGIAASGSDAGNYSFNTTANTTADISQLGITVDATGTNRVYDGSTADAVALVSAGVLSGDTVNFTGTGHFADKNVGMAKAVGVSGIAANGIDAGNYSFNTTANTTADITARMITVDATGVDKVYDGSTAATIAALGTTGLVAGDAVTFGNASAAFDDKNVGTGKTVTVNGIAASGADAGNYSYNTTANTTADISQRGITIDATGTNRVYDGGTADAVALASAGVLSGDTVNFTGTGNFTDKNVDTGKTVSVSGITASGSDANNYSFNTHATTTADITPATLTYRADTAHFKIGQMPGDLSGVVTGLVGGDTLDAATDGTLAWQTPATATSPAGTYTIDGSGLSALNYVFVQAPGNATALRVIDGQAPRVVTNAVAGLQRSSDDHDKARAPYTPDVHVVDGGVRLP